MSIVIQKKDLLEAMQKAFPVVPSKTSLQILSNFKLTYANSVFEVAATDADHSLRVTCGASGDENLDITVNAKKAFEMARELPDGPVTLTLDGMVLQMKSENGFFKITGSGSDDFPGIPVIEDGVDFGISGLMLREIINKSSFAVSKDESRASLCGILWELAPDKTGMIATDGHRLGCSFISTNLPVDEPFSRIISQKSVSTLVRIVDSKSEESIRVTIGDKYVSFETPSFTMVSKLVDGRYPDYSNVIPKNNPKIVIADRAALLAAVRRVMVLANIKNHQVKMNFTSGKVEILVKNVDIGAEARETVPISYDGEDHLIGINGQYFSEILDIAKTPTVKIEMNTQISACLIFPEYADEKDKVSDDLFLIMPLRVVDEA